MHNSVLYPCFLLPVTAKTCPSVSPSYALTQGQVNVASLLLQHVFHSEGWCMHQNMDHLHAHMHTVSLHTPPQRPLLQWHQTAALVKRTQTCVRTSRVCLPDNQAQRWDTEGPSAPSSEASTLFHLFFPLLLFTDAFIMAVQTCPGDT